MKSLFKLICVIALGLTFKTALGQGKVVKYSASDIKVGDYVAWDNAKSRYVAIDGGNRGDYEKQKKVDIMDLGKKAGFSDVTQNIVGVVIYVFEDGVKPGAILSNVLLARAPKNYNVPTDKDKEKKNGQLASKRLSGVWTPDGKTQKHVYIMSLIESDKKMVYSDENDNIAKSSCYPSGGPRIRDQIVLEHWYTVDDNRGYYKGSPGCKPSGDPKYFDITSQELYVKPSPEQTKESRVEKDSHTGYSFDRTTYWKYSYNAYVYYTGYDIKQALTQYNEKRGASHRIKPNHWALECDKKVPLKGSTSNWFVPTAEEIRHLTFVHCVNQSINELAKIKKGVKPLKENQNYWTIQEAGDNKAIGWFFNKHWFDLDLFRKKNAEFWVRCVAVI